jgi:TPR repeat protein/serine/threonine protein kinase
LAPNQWVGGLKLLAYLGANRFGLTYLATANDKGKRPRIVLREYMPAGLATRRPDGVAVRPLRTADRLDFEWGLVCLRQESEALAALDHPAITPVLGLIEENGTAYLAEAFAEGERLAVVLERRARLPEGEACFLLAPLLDALEQAHRMGLVHGGIEPDRIFIGRRGVPVLAGFGMQRAATPARALETDSGLAWNPYAANEIYDRRGAIGPWTDVYGLGAILYRAITGKAPPAAPWRLRVLERGEPDPILPLAEVSDWSASQLAAVGLALTPRERDRLQSIGALRAALAQAAEKPAQKSNQGQLFASAPAVTNQHKTMDTAPPQPEPLPVAAVAAAPAPAPGTPPAAPALSPRPRWWRRLRRSQRMWGAAVAAICVLVLGGWLISALPFDPVAAIGSFDADRGGERRDVRAPRDPAAARQAEEARRLEAAVKAEQARIAEERKRAEEARKAESERLAEERRKAEEERKVQAALAAEAARQAEEARKAEELREAEEGRRAEAARRSEQINAAAPAIEEAIERKDWAAARTALAELEQIDPDHVKVVGLRSRFTIEIAKRVAGADEAAARREWSEAAALLAEAALIQPDSPILAAGRVRMERARKDWEGSRDILERKAAVLIEEAVIAAQGFDFPAAAEKLGEAEQALSGFADDHPARVRLQAAVSQVQRAIDDVEFERMRTRDADNYLINRARADALFALAQKEFHEKKNAERACTLYREAGKLGHVGAQNQIGLCFATGRGMPRDATEAYAWFRRSAEGGNAIGQFNLAHAFATGAGVTRHPESAVEWARKSAEQGYPKGMCRLGLLIRDGEGVAADPKQALALFEKGAAKQDEWCMALLGEVFENGLGVEKNLALARRWYERAAAKGYEAAADRLKSLQ